MTTDRPGFALVLTMLLVLAIAVLGLGTLAVGTREAQIAGAVARKAQADRRAEDAALRAFDAWSTRALADLGIAEERTLGATPPGREAVVERIDSGLFLIRGRGSVHGPDGLTSSAVGLLVRVVPPEPIEAGFPAALAAYGPVTVSGGRVDGGAAGACGPPAPGVMAPAVAVAPGAAVAGDPPTVRATPPAPPAPDPLALPHAHTIATHHHPAPTATPRPLAVDGRCLPDGRNWGSPDAGHPCHGMLPVILASDLTINGGAARGIFIIDGDLRVTGGARLHGLVVVRGRLDLDGGSIHGAVRAGSARITEGTMARDACLLAAAASAPALDRAFRPPGRWWVPAF